MNGRSLQLLPDAASNLATRVDSLAIFLLCVCGFFATMICVTIVYFMLRYRRKSEDEIPPDTGEHPILEVIWSVVPLGILLVMFFWGAVLFADSKRAPSRAMRVDVVGKQWMWKVEHPGGQREINELHVPINTPVRLVMTSEDVIHDFSMPAFRIKQDVLPGSYVSEWFQANRIGEYHLFCSEYCGTDHSRMVGRVVVLSQNDYERWLAGISTEDSSSANGAKIFTKMGCAQCHGQTAPTLAGLFNRREIMSDGSVVVADENYIRESILDPSAKLVAGYSHLMPSYAGRLTPEEMTQLVAYIRTLGASRSDGPADRNNDSAVPPGRAINGQSPVSISNMPPARQPPAVEPPNEGNKR